MNDLREMGPEPVEGPDAGLRQAQPASEPDLRIAVLGVGLMGTFHVDALTRRVRGSRVVVVNDFLPDKAAAVAGAI
ncbi:MAG TPA: hypothetical protein VE617_12775, partial [Propionibacteriaceae bacterium]|nr:hypothetical protein [Propionibacteriaceae bacterium]